MRQVKLGTRRVFYDWLCANVYQVLIVFKFCRAAEQKKTLRILQFKLDCVDTSCGR